MKSFKCKKIVIASIAVSFVSANAVAASVDFRHEYKGKSKEHASRVKMGTSFENNLSVSLELKFKGEDGEFMKDLQSNGSELGIDYKWDINKQWAVQPGMPIEFSSSMATYKPQLRVTYKPEAIDSLSISARYRLDIKPSAEDHQKYRDRYTVNLGYSIQNLSLGLELNYYKAHDAENVLFNNKDTNYENNFTASYKMGSWSPWLEFGDVNVTSLTGERELRSRIGIRYSF